MFHFPPTRWPKSPSFLPEPSPSVCGGTPLISSGAPPPPCSAGNDPLISCHSRFPAAHVVWVAVAASSLLPVRADGLRLRAVKVTLPLPVVLLKPLLPASTHGPDRKAPPSFLGVCSSSAPFPSTREPLCPVTATWARQQAVRESPASRGSDARSKQVNWPAPHPRGRPPRPRPGVPARRRRSRVLPEEATLRAADGHQLEATWTHGESAKRQEGAASSQEQNPLP